MTAHKITLLALLLSAAHLFAAPPSNDNKANAQVLTGDTASITTSNVEATTEAGDFANRALWWKWTAGGNGSLSLDTINSTASSLSIAVYLLNSSGGISGTVWIKSRPNTVYVTANATYLIGVGTSSTQTSALGTLQLSLSLNRSHVVGTLPIAHAATMANDSFAQRISLTGNITSALCYTSSATTEAGEPTATQGKSFWWTYRPSSNGQLSLTSTNSVQDYPYISVFMGSNINSLRLVRESGGFSGASISIPVTAGADYVICYGTSATSPYGIGVLNLSLNTSAYISTLTTPPAVMENDSFAQRVSLTGDRVGAVAYNQSATTETGEPSPAGFRTFWWTYRPSANGILTISNQGSDISYPTITVYFGNSLNELKPLSFDEDFGSVSVALPVTAGADYLISYGTASNQHNGRIGSMVISLSLNKTTTFSALNIPAPATMNNDSFASSIQLTGSRVSALGYTLAATREAGEPDTGFRTVWFSWTANASGQAALDFAETPLSGLRGNVFTGTSVSSLTAVPLTAGPDNQVLFTAVGGTKYHLCLGETNSTSWRPVVVTFIGAAATPQAPNFTQHPVNGSGWLTVGQTLQLSAATDDSTATYQWRLNAASITGATSTSLSRVMTAVTMAGLYDVTARNQIGTTNSNDALVGVIAPLPTTVNVAEAGALALSLSARAPTAISYRWRKDGTPLTDGTVGKTIIRGSSTAALSITGMSVNQVGNYTCEVSMANTANPSAPFLAVSSACTVGLVLKPIVDDMSVPSAAVSRVFSWQLTASESPTGFTVTGLPAGLVANSTGLITGIPNAPGQPKVKVSARNAAGTSSIKEFTLNIDGLPTGIVGAYSGLFSRQSDLNSNLGGSFTLSVTSTGNFTGTVKNGLATNAITGRLNAPPSGNPTAVVSIPRTSPLPPLTLTLTFNGPGNAVSASLSNGSTSLSGEGRRHVFTSTGAAAYAAAYNSVVDLPSGSLNDTAQPLGCGWQQMTVAASGVVSGTGRTPDGISYTFAGTLWPDGSLPQFAILYASKSGSITGLPRISLGSTMPSNRVSGWVEQVKNGPASAADRTYRTVIPLLRRNVDGAPWIKPTTLMPIVMELPDAPDNADVAFTKGGIESAAQFGSLAQLFRINRNNTTTFKATTAGNPCAVSMRITSANGSFTGTFTLTDTVSGLSVKRTVNYSGILLSHTGMGYGYFTLPGLSPSITTSPILSGRVVVD